MPPDVQKSIESSEAFRAGFQAGLDALTEFRKFDTDSEDEPLEEAAAGAQAANELSGTRGASRGWGRRGWPRRTRTWRWRWRR